MDFLYEFETNNYYDIKRIYFKIHLFMIVTNKWTKLWISFENNLILVQLLLISTNNVIYWRY
jgi:hypothetical protein